MALSLALIVGVTPFTQPAPQSAVEKFFSD
jgi:hypothetical protein